MKNDILDITLQASIPNLVSIKEKLLSKISKSFYVSEENVLTDKDLKELKTGILSSKYLSTNNLNRDFVSSKGFSIVFTRKGISEVSKHFPFFSKYLELALDPYCNAFYLNPLLLKSDSRVDPHIDRSLRSYLKTIDTPLLVSVLYLQVVENLLGGELTLTNNKKTLGKIKPKTNMLLYFQGHLTHSVNQLKSDGERLSLVCEQYNLLDDELREIPEFRIESRTIKY